jgi:hypothetical protein
MNTKTTTTTTATTKSKITKGNGKIVLLKQDSNSNDVVRICVACIDYSIYIYNVATKSISQCNTEATNYYTKDGTLPTATVHKMYPYDFPLQVLSNPKTPNQILVVSSVPIQFIIFLTYCVISIQFSSVNYCNFFLPLFLTRSCLLFKMLFLVVLVVMLALRIKIVFAYRDAMDLYCQ